MKTYSVPLYLALMLSISLYACKRTNPEPQPEPLPVGVAVTVTLEISTSEELNRLSYYSKDPSYVKAFTKAVERHKTDTSSRFTDLFYDAWNEVEPEGELWKIFASHELRYLIDPESTNDEVIDVIRSECDKAIENTLNVLGLRLDRYGVTGLAMQRVGAYNKFKVELLGVEHPERLPNLLTASGRLGFWETYGNGSGDGNGVYDMLVKADNIIGQQSLFAILKPSVDPRSGQPLQTACIGVASVSDTAAVNRLLSLPQVRSLFPADMRLLWSEKSHAILRDSSHVDLVAIKANTRDGRAPLEGDYITDAKAIYDVNISGWSVLISMSAMAGQKWEYLTDHNIGRQMAIVFDDKVLSYPTVAHKITDGRSIIGGSFTQKEAQELVILLKSGELPLKVNIISVAIHENNDSA